MSGLVLKLAPNERVLINGAVIENGARRGRLNIVTPGANILRLRDALHPDEVNTPVRRVCYIAQLVLSGEVDPEAANPQLLQGIRQLRQVLLDDASQDSLQSAERALHEGQTYYVLKHLRNVLPTEERLFAVAQQ
jgi:flagellar protein FlbT